MLSSIIRTIVPVIVGWIVSALILVHVTLTADQHATLVGLVVTIVSTLYYTGVRFLEKKYPWATWLLLSNVQPVAYAPTANVVVNGQGPVVQGPVVAPEAPVVGVDAPDVK